jgi:hypothetical protein
MMMILSGSPSSGFHTSLPSLGRILGSSRSPCDLRELRVSVVNFCFEIRPLHRPLPTAEA